ncbi:type II toxin-antitoxin system VapC family toxin [Sphingomonas sp. QA11]|uniref:type II toxin-antitoxin system VapC family toxin n=1 Tax=Sphingomonas sp. QA11 TaxID=2950605 RepID=UPI00234A87A9|nr:type II toxin-antitoxin system VapC family toxin [Sphingomonas sp. QA11]WCM29561.1 type II toxin-antitoxin system VapC family toxin [Sphingomonas sp. QA11]
MRDEPEARAFLEVMATATSLRISAGSWLELTVVTTRGGDALIGEAADTLLARFDVQIEAVTKEIATIANDGYRRYGRGTRHAADLNFGDCFAYALAKATGEPLLFKGDDFTRTDIVPAL